jgi:hypothetical protein
LDYEDKYTITENDFADQFHKIAFGAIYKLHELGAETVSVENILDFLSTRPKSEALFKQQKGEEWLAKASEVAMAASFDYYYGRLKKMSLLRAYDSYGVDVSFIYDPDNILDVKKKQIQEDFIDNATLEQIAKKVDERIDAIRMEYVDDEFGEAHQAGEDIFGLIDRLKERPEVGVPLYGPLINTVTRGARLKKFYLRSAPTGVGKSRTMIADCCYIGCNKIYDENFGYFNSEAESIGFSDHLYWDNYNSVDGTGYSFNLGVIARPTDFLRLGVAYNSPTWYKMTNYYSAEAGAFIFDYYTDKQNPIDPSNPDMDREATTPTDFYTDYRLRTPDKWIFSAAAIIGQNALISVDYELANYKSMRLQDWQGYDQDIDNGMIKEDFRAGSMLKVGAEYKVTPQFAVRVGGAWQNSPVQDHMQYSETGDITEVYPAGTRTAYSIDRHVNYYTVGLGYRFTPNFYVDMACVYRMQEEEVYPFPHLINNGNVLVESIPSALKTNTTKVALTLGYKF